MSQGLSYRRQSRQGRPPVASGMGGNTLSFEYSVFGVGWVLGEENRSQFNALRFKLQKYEIRAATPHAMEDKLRRAGAPVGSRPGA